MIHPCFYLFCPIYIYIQFMKLVRWLVMVPLKVPKNFHFNFFFSQGTSTMRNCGWMKPKRMKELHQLLEIICNKVLIVDGDGWRFVFTDLLCICVFCCFVDYVWWPMMALSVGLLFSCCWILGCWLLLC